jgi:NAD(P)-dependent dehydrogenase (short-subunit alcohol dehydrogenase family)
MTGSTKTPVALITGAGRGIGADIAETLAATGYAVAVTDLDLQAAEGVAHRLGGEAVGLHMNVRSAESVERTAQKVRALGPLRAIVNNAGVNRTGPTATLPAELWDLVVDTNLGGTFRVSQAFGPLMFGAGGAIVNIGSMYSQTSAPGRAAYTASKHGIVGLTRCLAVEWGAYGVRVNAVLPGWLSTQMFDEQVRSGGIDLPYLMGRIPAGALGRGSQIAEMIRFLVSDSASYVTGQAIAVDGGYLANGAPAAIRSHDLPVDT